jgi:hypothetical protein
MEAATTPADGIFICYRREDGGWPAGWLYDRLVARFGSGRVFKDVDSIEPGDDFADVISNAVGSCAVLLAVIGPDWLQAAGESGRRLDDSTDFVRLEIEAALARGVRVVPVLVGHAQMPRSEQLPSSLSKLTTRHAVELSHAGFDRDLGPLMRVLDRVIGSESPTAVPRPAPATTQTRDTDAIAAQLARLESHGSPLVRQAYVGLAEIGYVMRSPRPRDPNRQLPSYLLFHDPVRPGPAVGYLTPQNISFTLDRENLKNEAGGRVIPSTGEVAFTHASPAGLARGLQVAKALKLKEVQLMPASATSKDSKSRYTNCVVCGWRFKEPGGQTRPNCKVPNACATRVSDGWLPGIGDPRKPHNLGGVTVAQARANQAAAIADGMLPR